MTNGINGETLKRAPEELSEGMQEGIQLQVAKMARRENSPPQLIPDSPLHSPTFSPDEDMSLEPATFHAVKLRLDFLDSHPQPLQTWHWTIVTNLLEGVKVARQDVSGLRILLLNPETLKCFRMNQRVHFARLKAFLQLIRNPKCPKSVRKWDLLDPTPFTPEERAEAVAHQDLPLWRPALLSYIEGNVTIKSGRYTAIGFRQILKGCKIFETILTDHPDQSLFHMEGIEPLLLSTAYVWSYCKPHTGMMNKVKTEIPIAPPKDPAGFLKHAPEWLQEATDAVWWQHFFSLYKPSRILDCIPIAIQHSWPAIRTGCEQWANGLVEKLLLDIAKPGKKMELETILYKAARAVTRLNVKPDSHFTLDKIRLWCPNLVVLNLQLCEPLENRNEKTFHFPKLRHLDLRFLPKKERQKASPPLFLDCLAGCPLLETLKIDTNDFPKLFCSFQKPFPDQFLPNLRVLEIAHVDLAGMSDGLSQRLFSGISRMAKIEELTLRNVDGLTAQDIKQLASLNLKTLKILFNFSDAFSEDMIRAVAALKIPHVELDSLSEKHYELFARLSEDKD